MYLGINIKNIREHWEVSQDEFAFLIGATRGMVMQYEKRGSKPKGPVMSTIEEITGLPKDILLNVKLKKEDLPELTQELILYLENYRNDPDAYPPATVSNKKETKADLLQEENRKLSMALEACRQEKEEVLKRLAELQQDMIRMLRETKQK